MSEPWYGWKYLEGTVSRYRRVNALLESKVDTLTAENTVLKGEIEMLRASHSITTIRPDKNSVVLTEYADAVHLPSSSPFIARSIATHRDDTVEFGKDYLSSNVE